MTNLAAPAFDPAIEFDRIGGTAQQEFGSPERTDAQIVLGVAAVVFARVIDRRVERTPCGAGALTGQQRAGFRREGRSTFTRVLEATGALDTALMNVTYFYNRDVKDAVDKGMAMIGPALTVFMGGMMMFILWAVLGPVYDILGKVKT